MGLFIAKLNKTSDLDSIANHFEENTDVHVKNKLHHLKMFVFESSPELAHSISLFNEVEYVKSSSKIGIVNTNTNQFDNDKDRMSEIKCEGIQSTTLAGEFSGNQEYFSHLELISKRNLDEELHEYNPIYTGKNVDCYIVDTGVKDDHPLLNSVIETELFKSTYTVNDKNDSNYDDNGHGTEIALFIAGTTCGVARHTNIIPLKVINKNGSGNNLNIAVAINEIIEHHKNKKNNHQSVINYSLGMMPSPTNPHYFPDETGDDIVTLDALKLATTFGIHVVAAAGNGFGTGKNFQGPMMSKFTNGSMNLSIEVSKNNDPGQGNPIVVGSTDSDSNLNYDLDPSHMSNFSNYGIGNTINTVGKSMIIPRHDWQWDTNEVYRWRTGTSFSCPIVAGLICLHLEENPSATPIDAKNWLIETSSKGIISNLMTPVDLTDSELIFTKESRTCIINLSYNLSEEQKKNKKIQLIGLDNLLKSVGFDAWYDIQSTSDTQIVFDFGEEVQRTETLKLNSVYLYFLDNTHESTDGMIKWQNESNSNKIISHESLKSDMYLTLFNVDETKNLYAFNPYIKSNISFSNELGVEYEIVEGLQSEIIRPRYIISDRDMGSRVLFSFLYEDKNSEIVELSFHKFKNKKYYYELPFIKNILSLYRGANLKKVVDSIILESKIEFNNEIKSKCSEQQLELINFFENFKKDHHTHEFKFNFDHTHSSNENDENKTYNVIELKNDDFKHGTIRITSPGYYYLSEDVYFHPNPDNDFMPTLEQIQSGKYPVGSGGAYHLGFFAAITIETNDVVLDLNGYKIQQTKMHNLHQRFFSVIEFANAPFIPSQGPHSFGDNFVSANRVLITNGSLDVSSHHGIHGNLANNIIINNLQIKNFEVAGIALNGSENVILNNISTEGTFLKIPILSGFSQAIFIRRHLEQIKNANKSDILSMPSCGNSKLNSSGGCPFSKTKTFEIDNAKSVDVSLNLPTGKLYIDDILEDLNRDIDHVVDAILNDRTPTNYFENKSGLYDGNMYGIVLHTTGVVVHDFLKERPTEATGNENILLTNVNIKNISSQPLEILGIESSSGNIQVGPFGDVFDVSLSSINQSGECIYKGNSLSNAQLFLEKYEIYTETNNLSKIESHIISWAETGVDLLTILNNENLLMIPNKDSMAHTMKGNIGLFISGAKNCSFDNILIDKVHTSGSFRQENTLIGEDKIKKPRTFNGADSSGILITASDNIKFENINIHEIGSDVDGANVCEAKILSGTEIHGLTETCMMDTQENTESYVKFDTESTCYTTEGIRVKFEYNTFTQTKAFIDIYSVDGFEKRVRINNVNGNGTYSDNIKYNKKVPSKLLVYLSDTKYSDRFASDSLKNLQDCTPIKIIDGVNFLSEETTVEISYNFESKLDLVIQARHNKTHVATKRIRDLDGSGTEEVTFKTKDGKVPNNLLVFATGSNWKNKTFHVKHNIRNSKPIKLDVNNICAVDGEVNVKLNHELHTDTDIVLQVYQGGKLQRTVKLKDKKGKGSITRKIKYNNLSENVKLIAFATKNSWKERFDFKKIDSVSECEPAGKLNFMQEEMCIFDTEVDTKIMYENIGNETDIVINVFSDEGFEQSVRIKKVAGTGNINKKIKLKKNFKPKRMIVFATNKGWKDRTHSEKIEIIEECEVEQLKDENQGDFFAPVCPLDIRICENGETLVRDPRNNCEFPECDGGDIRVCTEDAMMCKNGKVVGRNPFDDCNWYPCDDVGINPPDDSGEDYVMCPMDVKYCKDGSVVSRDHRNNCEFFKCPEEYRKNEDSNEDSNNMKACTKELKPCRDGTMVGRDPYNDCKFQDCPDNDIVLPPVLDDTDDLVCSAEVKMCRNGLIVKRDPKNDCKWEKCPPSIMNGIYLQDILVNTPHLGKTEIKILVEFLEGTTRWQYEINEDNAVTVESDIETLLLGPGIYKIKIYGINSDGEQVGRIFYEKVEIKGDGGDDHITPDPEPITPDPEEKPPVEPPYETPPPVDLDFDVDLFERNKKVWIDSEIKNYQFTVTRSYYGPDGSWRPVRVTVENGSIVDVKFADGLKVIASPDKSQYMTMTEMFEYVWNHYKNNVVQLDVEYDATYGFISSSYVDVDRRIVDEEMGIEISDFEAMDISIPEPPIVDCLSENVIVGVDNKKYTFTPSEIHTDLQTLESNSVLKLGHGMYNLSGISAEHPFGIHTQYNDAVNMYEKLIDIKPIGETIINVSGGVMSAPHYTFKLEDGTDISKKIYDGEYKFMKNKSYVFKNAGVSGVHPFRIGSSRNNELDWVHGTQLDAQTSEIAMEIPLDYEGELIYYCKNHPGMTSNSLGMLSKTLPNGERINFYYGDIEVCVNGDFGTTSYECYYHGYMGGENNLEFSEFCGQPLDDYEGDSGGYEYNDSVDEKKN